MVHRAVIFASVAASMSTELEMSRSFREWVGELPAPNLYTTGLSCTGRMRHFQGNFSTHKPDVLAPMDSSGTLGLLGGLREAVPPYNRLEAERQSSLTLCSK